MTLDIYVGREQVWCVSGSTRDISTLVNQKLESNAPGSRFPLFHRFFEQERIRKKKDLQGIQDEILSIKRGLATTPYPCASIYIGDLEVDYYPMRLSEGVFSGNSERSAGVDEKGLFIATEDRTLWQLRKKHFSEVTPDHEYFQDLIPPLEYTHTYQNKITRVARTFKGAGMVWKNTLRKFYDFAWDAQDKKTYLRSG